MKEITDTLDSAIDRLNKVKMKLRTIQMDKSRIVTFLKAQIANVGDHNGEEYKRVLSNVERICKEQNIDSYDVLRDLDKKY